MTAQTLGQMLGDAVALHRQGRLLEAEQLYRAALQIDNGNFDALHLLGILRSQQGRWDEAAELLSDAVRQNPASAEAHSDLGNALNETRRHDEAIANYSKAIALRPDFFQAHNNLGIALHTVERFEEAIASCRRALAINPDLSEAHYNIGNALYALDRHDEAIASFRSGLAIKPEDVESHNNLGLALNDLNRQDEAIALFDRALALKPDFADAHWNRGLALLTIGDFRNGLDEYEWRWRTNVTAPMQSFPRPLWLGATNPRGKTVLLHADQGLGDTIQFARYAPMVAARGARVVLQVLSPLKELMTGLEGVEAVVSRGEPLPDFDCHCPLSSLPRAFGTRLESIPARIPYVRASPGRVAKWEALLAGPAGPRIGLTWSGNRSTRRLRHRSISLARLLPLLATPGARFVSLQKDMPDEDASMLDRLPEITHLGHRLDDFADTAAAVSLLDLVISIDTSIVHLAGAMGKPVWVMLLLTQDWRWLLDREDSPWYPSARLFRQTSVGDWDGVIERVRTELLRFSPRA
jgi:tetratricopeptide (TPR) repeat protein